MDGGAARSFSTPFRATIYRTWCTWGPVLLQQMRKLPILTDLNTDQQNSGLQATLTYDRETASRLGITPQMLDNSLYEAFGQAQVSTMYTGVNQYHVVLEVAPKYWQSPVNLNDVYIRAAQGRVVPLSAVAHYQPSTAPLSVNHQSQYPSVTISFNLAPGVSLSDASRAIVETEQKIGMPSTITGMFSGTLQAFQSSPIISWLWELSQHSHADCKPSLRKQIKALILLRPGG